MTITEIATTLPADRAFTTEDLEGAPTGPGVYVLLRRGRIVMIDATPELRVALAAHQRGERGARTASATQYRTQETTVSGAGERCAELMEDYRQSHNSNVPPGNRVLAVSATTRHVGDSGSSSHHEEAPADWPCALARGG